MLLTFISNRLFINWESLFSYSFFISVLRSIFFLLLSLTLSFTRLLLPLPAVKCWQLAACNVISRALSAFDLEKASATNKRWSGAWSAQIKVRLLVLKQQLNAAQPALGWHRFLSISSVRLRCTWHQFMSLICVP